MSVWYQGKQMDLKAFKSLYQKFIGVPTDQYTTLCVPRREPSRS
jgi:hypothetical protein